ncbi:TetR/AcrR family transcriptional regulator [Acinetobacter ursingii]|uniref:TetR/AcrR family transcriptional regulator n=1 Tax=Acinetobacter ursingii TaxID=108980 RepID=UPI00195A0ACD|nr:TetR/AcrR family transcriptional regulator [Acinetobacter ursingii]
MSKHIKRAAKNREDLLEAAVEMFKIHGMSVPLQIIIDHAGVGRATFYRNFTDRKALVYALLEQAVSHLELRAEQYRMYDDGLIRLIKSHVHNLNNLSALMEYWRVLDQHDEVLISLIQHHQLIVQPLIDRAIEKRICRPDFNFEDYRSIVSMLSLSFRGHDETQRIRFASRAVELLLNGICLNNGVYHG